MCKRAKDWGVKERKKPETMRDTMVRRKGSGKQRKEGERRWRDATLDEAAHADDGKMTTGSEN